MIADNEETQNYIGPALHALNQRFSLDEWDASNMAQIRAESRFVPHAEKLRQQNSRSDELMSLLDSLRWYYNFQRQDREEIEINEQLWDLSKELKGLRDYVTLENARLLSESYSDASYHAERRR
jgi:hypothetical protein